MEVEQAEAEAVGELKNSGQRDRRKMLQCQQLTPNAVRCAENRWWCLIHVGTNFLGLPSRGLLLRHCPLVWGITNINEY